MKHKINEYKISNSEEVEISRDAEILSVYSNVDSNEIFLLVYEKNEASKEKRKVHVIQTGEIVDSETMNKTIYLGTVQIKVWLFGEGETVSRHIFIEKSAEDRNSYRNLSIGHI
jgi:hypothetical protein